MSRLSWINSHNFSWSLKSVLCKKLHHGFRSFQVFLLHWVSCITRSFFSVSGQTNPKRKSSNIERRSSKIVKVQTKTNNSINLSINEHWIPQIFQSISGKVYQVTEVSTNTQLRQMWEKDPFPLNSTLSCLIFALIVSILELYLTVCIPVHPSGLASSSAGLRVIGFKLRRWYRPIIGGPAGGPPQANQSQNLIEGRNWLVKIQCY